MATLIKSSRSRPRSNGRGKPAWDVALGFPLQGDWTEADYLALDAIGNRMIELNDGLLEVLPMPDMLHQDIVRFLFVGLDAFVMQRRLGRVYFAPLPVRLWQKQFREPDIVFLATRRIKDKRQPPTGAELVMEVVSRGLAARRRDLAEKRRVYARAKIPEYWIIDPETKTITVLTLSGTRYKRHGAFKDGAQATSKLLKGFQVAVRDVFAAGEAK